MPRAVRLVQHRLRDPHQALPLGEAHDSYSAGALFYFIMTEQHLRVQSLASFVRVLQENPCALTARQLKRRHGETYLGLRNYLLIPDPYWRDRAMELILRAMVRKRAHSFNESRIERGPKAALNLLRETRRLYRELQEELVSEQRVRRHRLAIPICILLSALATMGIGEALHPKAAPIPPTTASLAAPPLPDSSLARTDPPSAIRETPKLSGVAGASGRGGPGSKPRQSLGNKTLR
jgi:hypothetical protein